MSEYEVIDVKPAPPEVDELAKWFAQQHLKSPDTLDAAARQIITLVTTLLALLFTVLTVASQPLPPYFQLRAVISLGVLSVIFLLAALLMALLTLRPQRIQVSGHKPEDQRDAFAALVERKAGLLTAAHAFFFCGLLALGAVLIIAILNVAA